MRHDFKETREDVEKPIDPANPNKNGAMEWDLPTSEFMALDLIAGRVHQYLSDMARQYRKPLHVSLLEIQMDFVCVHRNILRLDIPRMLSADIIEIVADYSVIFANLDRTCGKLPGYATLRFALKN